VISVALSPDEFTSLCQGAIVAHRTMLIVEPTINRHRINQGECNHEHKPLGSRSRDVRDQEHL